VKTERKTEMTTNTSENGDLRHLFNTSAETPAGWDSPVIDTTVTTGTRQDAHYALNSVSNGLSESIVDQLELIQACCIGLATGRHVKIIGSVGVVKSHATKVLAALVGGTISRVQCTIDTMPMDFTGYIERNPFTDTEKLIEGPLFSDFVHLDEGNRASPRSMSGVLEAMEEHTITIGRVSHKLNPGQVIVMTLNPDEHAGTDQLPDAVEDRLGVCVVVGMPDYDGMMRIVRKQYKPLDQVTPVLVDGDLANIQKHVKDFARKACNEAADVAVRIILATHDSQYNFAQGASPRAGEVMIEVAGAIALMNGAGAIVAQDVYDAAVMVLRHRLSPKSDALYASGLTRFAYNELRLQEIITAVQNGTDKR
jgi:MoxR-like ATPase